MTTWRYDEDLGTEVTTEILFEALEPVEYQDRQYAKGDEITLSLPKPIDRATLDDMAGEGGPWGWGGYTNEQLDALVTGNF